MYFAYFLPPNNLYGKSIKRHENMPYNIFLNIILLDFVRWRLQNEEFLTYSSIIGMGLVTQNTLSVRVIKKNKRLR